MFNPVNFMQDAYGELRKVTWIPRKQVVASTVVVVLLVAIVSFFISFADYVIAQIFSIFIRM